MSTILSTGTALPAYAHRQSDILTFMQQVYAPDERERRKLRFIYNACGIEQRYSVLSDYGKPAGEWKFFPAAEGLEPFPSLEQRMAIYHRMAPQLSIDAIRNCLSGVLRPEEVTHLITVSCTGMSAPGLDLQVMEGMDLPKHIFRTSVNFMGCYAALHALRLADALCAAERKARVLIVCTELCTLHFQREATADNITSSLLFGDGSAAVLVVGDDHGAKGLKIDGFHSRVLPKGRRDMAWELSSSGFLMTLSGYVPELIEADFKGIVSAALEERGLTPDGVAHWCIHPGGKKILEAISASLELEEGALDTSYDVLRRYGNLSSPTVLFVLDELRRKGISGPVFGAAFGPGLTVETFVASPS